jgi:uncharacterized protein
MTIHFTAKDFKEVAWKNGGGKTLELYRLDNPQNPGSFLFRLSQATVNSSGPFSIFKDIDRILYLIKGEGFTLKNGSELIKLDETFQSYCFNGESDIYCDLKSESIDFNIMIDRQWGHVNCELIVLKKNAALEIRQQEPCFLYSYALAPMLISIEANENYTFLSESETKIIKISIIQS